MVILYGLNQLKLILLTLVRIDKLIIKIEANNHYLITGEMFDSAIFKGIPRRFLERKNRVKI